MQIIPKNQGICFIQKFHENYFLSIPANKRSDKQTTKDGCSKRNIVVGVETEPSKSI